MSYAPRPPWWPNTPALTQIAEHFGLSAPETEVFRHHLIACAVPVDASPERLEEEHARWLKGLERARLHPTDDSRLRQA